MIIFLYGEDTFRSAERLAEIKQKFLEKNKEGASLFVFDFGEKEWDQNEIILAMSSGNLFASKKLVVIKNMLSAKKFEISEKFLNILKNMSKSEKGSAPATGDLILVFWESGKIKKSEKIYKLLHKVAKCQEFEFLEGVKLNNWITEKVKELNKDVSIGQTAVEKLIVFVGNDLHLLSMEIEKLVSYKGKGMISTEDVDLLVKSRIDTDIFKTIDALAMGDKKSALKLLHDHLEAGEDSFYLLSMYFYQFRNLVKVKALVEKNMPPSEIAAKLKMHPFVVRKSLDQARNFSWPKLKELYNDLCTIDYESKVGKTDIELALDKFVAGI